MTRSSLIAGLAFALVLSACGPSKLANVTVGGVEMTAERSLLENAGKADMLRTFVGMVRQAKLDATLEGTGPFTIFAPNDQAFLALPPEALLALTAPENADLLSQLLSYHIVTGTVRTADLRQGTTLRTVEGNQLVVQNDGKGTITINGMPIAIADIPGSNGVMHILNGVLLPPVNTTAPATTSSASNSSVSSSSSSVSAAAMPESSSSIAAASPVAGLMMKDGAMYRVMENGSRDPLKMDVQLSNGTKVMADGTVLTAAGAKEKLQNGEMIMMSGEKTMDPPQQTTSSSQATQAGTMAMYGVLTDGVIGNGKTSVLFFHAKWCPDCKNHDAELATLYGAGKATLPTYRVDYDTAAALKQQYQVVVQDTFVVIDGTGKGQKTVMRPSSDQLMALVQGK